MPPVILCRCLVVVWTLALFSSPAYPYTSTYSSSRSIVTGANGYVGREVVHALLSQSPHAPIVCLVRPSRLDDERRYWKQRDGSAAITVLPYDMLDGGKALRHALDHVSRESTPEGDVDCCVYHVASVFGPTEDHVQTALDNVRGTEDVVRTIARHGGTSPCRLVLTSSMAAVRGTGQRPKNGKLYTYRDWNQQSQLGDNWGSSYQWSKAESERRAWELAQENTVPVVSLCPSFVFGPVQSSQTTSQSYSIQLVGQWVRGESPVQSRLCVDVRDVAMAHVAAGTTSNAVGNRYILSKEARIPSQVTANVLRRVATHPDRITYDSEFQGGAIPIGDREVEAEERLQRDLGGLVLRSVEETMEDMGRMLVEMAEKES